MRLTATDVRCLQASSKVAFYKNQATVDLVPKGGKLPMCGDIYICLYDADLGSKDVSRDPPSATHKPLSCNDKASHGTLIKPSEVDLLI